MLTLARTAVSFMVKWTVIFVLAVITVFWTMKLALGRIRLSADDFHVLMAGLGSSSAGCNGDPQSILQSD
ncbi:hypothetical protein AB3480_10680 [Rhizobium mongolense]|uniref:hypothetical protein n=1 Tax=Rhizobium mongolense TaxID=57676 RepID=UPI0034A1B831